jgi:hypothetical protein
VCSSVSGNGRVQAHGFACSAPLVCSASE